MSSVLLGGVLCALIPLAFHALTGLGVVEADDRQRHHAAGAGP